MRAGHPFYHLLNAKPLLTFQRPSLLLLEAAEKKLASWTPHSLPKDGEASVATEMAQLVLFGKGRLAGRMASPGPPFHSHFGPGGLDVTGEDSGLRGKS